jgi:glutamate-1-semialdehyde 2,1-aminomutase
LEVEVEVAEMLVALLPHVDKVRFANTGTEAAMAAFRLARGHTGRRKIIKFEGHYHGWWDSVLVNTNPLPPTMLGHPNDPIRIPDSSGIPEEAWKDTIVVRWNDVDALERAMALHGHDAACVVTEGVMSNMGVVPPKPGYLNRMQELCHQYGALFYLDETVTGFRLAAGGAAEIYGLTPDIVTYGKALGGGLPMAMIGGRAEIMAGLEWGKVLHYGTHNAGRLSLHLTKVMLETMLADNQAGFAKIKDLGLKMAAEVRRVAKASNRHGIVVQGVNSMFQIFFTDQEEITDFRDFCTHVDRTKFRDFALRLMDKGIYMNPSATLHSLSSIVHTEADIAATARAMAEVLEEMP